LAVLSIALSATAPAHAEGEFTPPTDEQISALVADPSLLGAMIKDATIDDIVDILVRALKQVETSDMDWPARQAKTSELFDAVYEAKGAAATRLIVAEVRKKVNPRLLPVISVGSPYAPALPPILPKYERQ